MGISLMKGRIIFCDFDGTITHQDIGNIILNRFSHLKWDSLDKEFISGKIGSMCAYQKIAPHIQGARKDIEDFIRDNFDVDEAFPRFVQNCYSFGDTPVILSDGFDIYIQILLQKRALENKIPYKANRWSFKDGRVHLSFPYYNPDCEISGGKCGNCKLSHLIEVKREKNTRYGKIVYIGNGYSDRCPIDQADLVLAKDGLKDYCLNSGIEFLSFNNFQDVNLILFAKTQPS